MEATVRPNGPATGQNPADFNNPQDNVAQGVPGAPAAANAPDQPLPGARPIFERAAADRPDLLSTLEDTLNNGQSIPYGSMLQLLSAIDNRSSNYSPSSADLETNLLIRCLRSCLGTADTPLSNEHKVQLFETLLETLAKISIDPAGHSNNNYWVPIIENLTYALKIVSQAHIHNIFRSNKNCFNFNIKSESRVNSNDPFQYFLWLLEKHSSQPTDTQSNYAQRLNIVMRTLEGQWDEHFPNRTLVKVTTEENPAACFMYTTSTGRICGKDYKEHNLTKASQQEWFTHVVGNLFPATLIEKITDDKHSELNAQYQLALKEYSLHQSTIRRGTLMGGALGFLLSATAFSLLDYARNDTLLEGMTGSAIINRLGDSNASQSGQSTNPFRTWFMRHAFFERSEVVNALGATDNHGTLRGITITLGSLLGGLLGNAIEEDKDLIECLANQPGFAF